jgi:uncharacterized pyridoxamine 5'-phosphate oxidase family protein
MKEVYEFLKKCGAYYLATVDGDQPRVRPFGTVLIFEDKLYIQTGKVKNVSKQMMKNSPLMTTLLRFDTSNLRRQPFHLLEESQR